MSDIEVMSDDEFDDDIQNEGVRGRTLFRLLASALLLGLLLGGAYALGLQMGRGQAPVEETPPLAFSGGQTQSPNGQARPLEQGQVTTAAGSDSTVSPQEVQAMREAGLSEEEIEEIVAQMDSASGIGGQLGLSVGLEGEPVPGNAETLTGRIESIEGDTITIATEEGPRKLSTISGTRVRIDGTITDLAIGDAVDVVVVPGPEEDVLEVASITVGPVDE